MEVFVIIAVILAALFFFSVQRGKKAVRAFMYLKCLSSGDTEQQANLLVSRINASRASEVNHAMRDFVRLNFANSQLTMISAAREAGFRG